MPIINEYDALTDINTEKSVTKTQLDSIIGEIPSFSLGDLMAEKAAAKASAVAKLAALGLNEEEIKAITS